MELTSLRRAFAAAAFSLVRGSRRDDQPRRRPVGGRVDLVPAIFGEDDGLERHAPFLDHLRPYDIVEVVRVTSGDVAV